MFDFLKPKNELDLEVAALKEERDDLKNELNDLREEIVELKTEVKEKELEYKVAEEDIKHMVRMKEERQELELEKKKMELERAHQEAVAAVKDQYRNKLETQLKQETVNMKDMYSEILKRLPDVNVKLRGEL